MCISFTIHKNTHFMIVANPPNLEAKEGAGLAPPSVPSIPRKGFSNENHFDVMYSRLSIKITGEKRKVGCRKTTGGELGCCGGL